MISDTDVASVYTDFHGLMRLKAEAGNQTPEAKRETARQFEAMFVQMMLKSMREATPGDGLFDSDQVGFYRDLYDRQLAMELVKGRGLGIADMLAAQMDGQPAAAHPAPAQLHNPARAAEPPPFAGKDATARPLLPSDPVTPLVSLQTATPPRPLIDLQDTGAQAGSRPAAGEQDWRPDSPADFVRDLWQHARQGAAVLGVNPEVLVAQAALESGWGRQVIRFADGRNSFNLFGIKADPGWQGERVTVRTLEYEDGVATRQRASFRAYDSIGAAVAGYVDFIRNNPRYRQALERAADPEAYLHGLKDAGYATDPHYVDKIRSILKQDSFDAHVSELKISGDLPLT